jgi:NADPH:quinone reductase-like Zn-dependent oxidoreductase
VRFPIPKASAEKVRTLATLLAEGRFRPLIDRRYPLSDVREAFAYVASGRKVGHVLLDVASLP